MLHVSMLADSAIRVSFGLILALILTNWQDVPLRFFRIQYQIVLVTLVLGALDQARAGGPVPASRDRHHGRRPRIPGDDLVGSRVAPPGDRRGDSRPRGHGGLVGCSLAVNESRDLGPRFPEPGALGLLMGATLTAMLLGHYYLIAPAMTIEPLKRSLNLIGFGLIARCLFAGVGLWAEKAGWVASGSSGHAHDTTFLVMRWGIGILGTALSLYLARRTVAIRSTQSATGILYITSIFVLLGELTSIVGKSTGMVG